MPAKKALSPESMEKAGALWRAGKPAREIGLKFGISADSVRHIALRNRGLFPMRNLPLRGVTRKFNIALTGKTERAVAFLANAWECTATAAVRRSIIEAAAREEMR